MSKTVDPISATFERPYVAPPFAREGSVSLERGTYLAMGPAACMGCHSDIVPKQNSIAFDGPVGAGNSKQPMPDLDDPAFEFAGPNLSADPETGHLAGWSKEQFITRMYAGRMFASSPMPWETYRNMTREDLESLWLWVQSIPPTKRNTGPLRREAGWKPPS